MSVSSFERKCHKKGTEKWRCWMKEIFKYHLLNKKKKRTTRWTEKKRWFRRYSSHGTFQSIPTRNCYDSKFQVLRIFEEFLIEYNILRSSQDPIKMTTSALQNWRPIYLSMIKKQRKKLIVYSFRNSRITNRNSLDCNAFSL